MEHQQHGGDPITAGFYALLSIWSALMAFTLKDVQTWLSIVASVGALVSAGFAVRYYYYSTKKIKHELRKRSHSDHPRG